MPLNVHSLVDRIERRVAREGSSMMQIDMSEAQTDLPELIQLLETRQEEVILITKDGEPVAEMKLTQRQSVSKRIGVAKGKLNILYDFDKWDDEIEDMFNGSFDRLLEAVPIG